MKSFWDAIDIVKFMAMCITVSFIALVFTVIWFRPQLPDAAWAVVAVLSQAFTLLIGFYWGSSAGSKAKDAAIIPAATAPAPPATPAQG